MGGCIHSTDVLRPLFTACRAGSTQRPQAWVAAGLRICLVLLDAVGELGHLIEELAVFAHLRVDLLH